MAPKGQNGAQGRRGSGLIRFAEGDRNPKGTRAYKVRRDHKGHKALRVHKA